MVLKDWFLGPKKWTQYGADTTGTAYYTGKILVYRRGQLKSKFSATSSTIPMFESNNPIPVMPVSYKQG